MAFQMDPGEILRDYNAAANKDKSVAILADLNVCRPLDIALFLREQGADLSATWKARLATHDRAGMRIEMQKDLEELNGGRLIAAPTEETDPLRGGPSRTPAPTENAQKAVLTAGALQELLAAVPGDTPVQICGHPGQATAALFIMRADSRGTGCLLRIQRGE